jgi:Raf kinase inhibitor-like YbhB/YbcL family protein
VDQCFKNAQQRRIADDFTPVEQMPNGIFFLREIVNASVMTTLTKTALAVTSSAFEHETLIPKKYTCEGENMNPPLRISHVPKETQSLVLIIDDPDAPDGTYDHWLVWNIRPFTEIAENTYPGRMGVNSAGIVGYTGPCPPTGVHRYFFKVYALDKLLDLPEGCNKQSLMNEMEEHILASGTLIGLYRKKQQFSEE